MALSVLLTRPRLRLAPEQEPPPGPTLSIDQEEPLTGTVGDTIQLSATASDGAVATWSSSNELVARVEASGLVTLVGAGPFTITADHPTEPGASDDISGSAEAEVSPASGTFAIMVKTAASPESGDLGLQTYLQGLGYTVPFMDDGTDPPDLVGDEDALIISANVAQGPWVALSFTRGVTAGARSFTLPLGGARLSFLSSSSLLPPVAGLLRRHPRAGYAIQPELRRETRGNNGEANEAGGPCFLARSVWPDDAAVVHRLGAAAGRRCVHLRPA